MPFYRKQPLEGVLFLAALLWTAMLVFHLRLFAGESDATWSHHVIAAAWDLFFFLLAFALPAGNRFPTCRLVALVAHAGIWGFIAFSLARITGFNGDVGLYFLLSFLAFCCIFDAARQRNVRLERWLEGHVQ